MITPLPTPPIVLHSMRWRLAGMWAAGVGLVLALLLVLASTLYLGWILGTDHATTAADHRAHRTAIAHDQALIAERSRTAAAQAAADAATRRAVQLHRRARLAQAELRELRATIAATPFDGATGIPVADNCETATP